MRSLRSVLVAATALLLVAAAPAAVASTATAAASKESKKRGNGPFQRLQQTAGGRALNEEAGAGAKKKAYHPHDKHPTRHMLANVNTPEKIAFLQGIQKNGLDPVDVLTTALSSTAFQEKILGNVEIQHRILEGLPMLHAIPGFAEVKGRRLSDEETTAGFAKGVQTLIDISKSVQKLKDPDSVFKVVADLAKSEDPEIQAMFEGTRRQDEASFLQLRALIAEELFPGVDLGMLEELKKNANFDKILSHPELDRFVDQDQFISNILRTPHD